MTDKYINLGPKIAGATRKSLTSSCHLAQLEALRWLDDHPEQVPKRTMTITEQQLIQLWQVTVEGRNIDDFAQELKDNGITVVPDPEPTNAEQIEEIIGKVGSFPSWERRLLAEGLDKAGVKAPEGGR